MRIETREVAYEHDGAAFEGVLAFEGGLNAGRPTVLVLHGIEGRSEAQVDYAKKLVEWGYVAFAADIFGKNATEGDFSQYAKLMNSFLEDRARLQQRLLRVVDVVKELPEVKADRIAAAGFCFGGLCALELARIGAGVRAVASFHGLLTPPGNTAGNKIDAKVIVFHGWDDPYAPPQDVVSLGRELSEAGADWQIHAYGNTMHAFMAPGANNPEAGIQYNEVSARRALASLKAFLPEALL